MDFLHTCLSWNCKCVKDFHELLELERELIRQPQLAFNYFRYILCHFECVRISSKLAGLIVFSSLKVWIVVVSKLLFDLLLASNLRFNSYFVPLAVVIINYFRDNTSKEVVDFWPLLASYVQFILNWVSIHDVGQYGKLFFVVEVF